MSNPNARPASSDEHPRPSPLDRAEDLRERSLRGRERAADVREKALRVREGEEAGNPAGRRELVLASREGALLTREEAARLREDAIRAREEAARARIGLEQLTEDLRHANEQLVVATVQAQDMTEAADRANHLKDEFLASVSHELRTPLTSVLGWARMLTSGQVPETRIPRALATIERNASMLAHIIDDLLDISRALSGTLLLIPEPVDLRKIAEEAIDGLKVPAQEKSIQVSLASEVSAAEPVSADAGRLHQVIWNLLTNAMKFTPAGGRIDVSITRSDRDIELAVADTGEGIDAAFLPHVFEPFRQAENATTRRHTGLGLGLAIVRRIAELHGGSVRAASGGLGLGATFTFCLPLPADVEPGADLSPAPTSRKTLQRLDGLRVLLVEDHPDAREMMSMVLELAGAHVAASGSARGALEALKAAVPPDILVSDIALPDEDGYSLIRTIRRQEAERGGFLPAVALTGFARQEDRARVLAAGFQAHVPKPVDPAELTTVIAALRAPPRNPDRAPDRAP